mgnify:CR=1 FL=1
MKAFDDEVSEDCSDYKAEDNAVENKGVVECFTVMGSQKAVQILGSVLKFPIHIVVAAPLLRILRKLST